MASSVIGEPAGVGIEKGSLLYQVMDLLLFKRINGLLFFALGLIKLSVLLYSMNQKSHQWNTPADKDPASNYIGKYFLIHLFIMFCV